MGNMGKMGKWEIIITSKERRRRGIKRKFENWNEYFKNKENMSLT